MTKQGLALALLLWLVAGPVGAVLPVVRVVGPDPVAARVEAALAGQAASVEVRRDAAPAALVVAIGAQAFRDALADTQEQAPVVGIALSRHAYRALATEPGRYTALYWDPDPARQLRLVRALLPGAQRVGVVLGAPDDPLTGALRREGARLGLDVVVGVIGRKGSLPRSLNTVLAGSDALLGIDDPAVFSPELAKTTLLTSYRHGKPVFGPTSAYVVAGSVASLATDLDATVAALADWLPALLAPGPLPAPRYLDRYRIATNPQVARSLNLSLPPVPQLEALPGLSGNPP